MGFLESSQLVIYMHISEGNTQDARVRNDPKRDNRSLHNHIYPRMVWTFSMEWDVKVGSQPNHWYCSCGQPNAAQRKKCLDCGEPKPDEGFKAYKRKYSRRYE